jgi:DNA-binding NarL/FixJ family response regulator
MRPPEGPNGRAQVPPSADDAYGGRKGSPSLDDATMPNGGRTILLVDDHDVVRQGLRLLIETRLEYAVVEAASADEALAVVEGERVDLVLLDARMPEHDGIWALRRLREAHPEIPVLVLSTYDTEDYVENALDAGASGYVLKEATTAQLGEAIETALSNKGVYLYPAVAQRVLARNRRGSQGSEDALSDRELDVLRLLSEGATNEEIAGRLFLSEKTVKSHLSSIFRKLEVTNRTQAAARAIRDRMVPLRGA